MWLRRAPEDPIFGACGPISYVKIFTNANDHVFAFVEFMEVGGAQAAFALQGITLGVPCDGRREGTGAVMGGGEGGTGKGAAGWFPQRGEAIADPLGVPRHPGEVRHPAEANGGNGGGGNGASMCFSDDHGGGDMGGGLASSPSAGWVPTPVTERAEAIVIPSGVYHATPRRAVIGGGPRWGRGRG